MYVRRPDNTDECEMPGRADVVCQMPIPGIIRRILEIAQASVLRYWSNRRLQGTRMAQFSLNPQISHMLFPLVRMHAISLGTQAAEAGLREDTLCRHPREGGALKLNKTKLGGRRDPLGTDGMFRGSDYTVFRASVHIVA